MQIVETTNEGLKRGYTLTIPASFVAEQVEGEVKRLAPQVKMPGFRAGKVPVNLVRKMHGAQLRQEALNTAIRDGVNRLVAEHKLRPATQPQVSIGENYVEGGDVELTVVLEVLPVVSAPDLTGIKLEKLVVPVREEQVDEAVNRVAGSAKHFVDAPEDHAAVEGNQLVIDFVGKIDGTPFEGGKAEDSAIEIGAGRYIPGFEEQLVGAKLGEERTIKVTFPEDYPAANLKAKDASFDITVKAIKQAGETIIDDEFAQNLGLADLASLRDLLKGQLEEEQAGLTRTQMKRQLLDTLAAGHDFDVPSSMVEAEFEQIWQQLLHEISHEEDPEAARAEMESEKDDYRAIAVRRVRLGLLLSEIGQTNGIEITQAEMKMLIQRAAQQYRPEDRQRFVEYVRNDAMAAAQIRAPLYEEKVVDFLFNKAEITEREVTREELEAAIEVDEHHEHGPDCQHDHANKADIIAAESDQKDSASADKAKKVSSANTKPAVATATADQELAETASELATEDAPKKKAAPKKKTTSETASEDSAPAGDALVQPKKKTAPKKDAAKDI